MWALSWWGYWLHPPCSSYFKYTTRRHILTQTITLTLPLSSSFLFLYLYFLDSISTQSYLKESFINPHTLSEYGPANPLGIIPVFRVYVLPKKAWGLILLAFSLETVTLSSWTLLGGFNNDPVTEFLAHSRQTTDRAVITQISKLGPGTHSWSQFRKTMRWQAGEESHLFKGHFDLADGGQKQEWSQGSQKGSVVDWGDGQWVKHLPCKPEGLSLILRAHVGNQTWCRALTTQELGRTACQA